MAKKKEERNIMGATFSSSTNIFFYKELWEERVVLSVRQVVQHLTLFLL